MTDNEKRAHDLACTVMASDTLFNTLTFTTIVKGKSKIFQQYQEIYEIYLACFNKEG